jgi:hypothetical protein
MACHVAHHTAVVCAGRTLERGAAIRDFDQAGSRAAWTVAHGGRIELREAKDGRIVFRRRVGGDQVAVSSRGDLAWAGQHVVLKPAGARARVLGRGYYVAFEDDRTLRWQGDDDTMRYRDLSPPPQSDGCPDRAHFATIAETPQVLVTRARYDDFGDLIQVIRACVRGGGQDRVLDHTFASAASQLGVAAIAGTTLLMWRTGTLSDAYVETLDAGAGGILRRAANAPAPDAPGVLTAAGAPVWIAGTRVLTIDPHGLLVTLDSGGPFTGLRADGATVSWSDAGVAHQAQPA